MIINEDKLKNIVRDSIKKVLNEKSALRTNVDTTVHLEEVTNFNNVLYGRDLNESSINRMLHWLNKCDCAFISAFRNELKDVKNGNATYFGPNGDWEEGKKFSHEENREKNRNMVAELLMLGYGVAKTKGVYPEGMTGESSEESYLVVNRNNDKDFLENLMRIAEYYNQDSIYYKEAGAEEGHLIGTNGCGWPEYHESGDGSKLKVGTASNYMSRLGNHAFSFVGTDSEKTADRKAAMDSIENSKGTDDEWRQRHWTDNDGTSFQARKELRKKNLSEAVSFWRNLVNGGMMVKEEIHPLTRKTMGEALRKYKATH